MFAHRSARGTTTIAHRSQGGGSFPINCVVFFQATFDFIIIGFVVFMAVRQVNHFKKDAPLLLRNFPRYGNEKTHTIDDPHNPEGRDHHAAI
jgi:large-conductance mechanosensitive channel